jgi:hypothetical protein
LAIRPHEVLQAGRRVVTIERRNKLTRAEWAAITSSRPVIRKVLDRGNYTRAEKMESNGAHENGHHKKGD